MLVMMLPFGMAAWLRAVTGRTPAVATPRWLSYAAIAALAVWTVVRQLAGGASHSDRRMILSQRQLGSQAPMLDQAEAAKAVQGL
jgi:hypothetical protein